MADGYTGTDFYCDVAIPFPDKLDVEYESDRVLAFHHTRPFWQHHVVIVPKRHIASLISVASADEPDIRELLLVVQQLARRADVRDNEN